MHLDIKITKEDIRYAETILLKEGITFNEQRANFIRNLNTLDLQAVPGSGKTTALLAKLLILERYLPLKGGAGILVLSHTNTAIEEITNRIQRYCPRLFSYPNFIGTIQRFTDEFLAFPYYSNKYKRKIVRIDNEIYKDTVERLLKRNLSDFENQDQKNAKYYLISNQYAATYRLRCINGKFKLYDSINGKELEVSKPKRGKNYKDFTIAERKQVRLWLVAFKTEIMKQGILHFDDAYFLAETYIQQFPQIKEILQKRFSLICVDEMQDMDTHQYNLLETLFYDNGASASSYQRIGDKNQAIFNGTAKIEKVWEDRALVLPITGSPRLSPTVAKIVNRFALHQGFEIEGLSSATLKPHMIVYSDKSIELVIPRFLLEIAALQEAGTFPLNPYHPIKIVAWNTEWKEDNKPEGKFRLIDYFDSYSKVEAKPRTDHHCLLSYLFNFDKTEQKLGSIRKSILNGILMILRLEDVKTSSGMKYSKKSMIEAVKNMQTSSIRCYDDFQLNLYNWCIGIIQGKVNDVWMGIKQYLPEFLQLFQTTISMSKLFIETKIDRQNDLPDQTTRANCIDFNGRTVDISTVHSVKGQTHSATLYLETAYYGHHESERLFAQVLGENFNSTKVRDKESAKMAYVGFSRPTDLLCIAIHEDHYNSRLQTINDSEEWTIIRA
jgi:DNA helicase-2/ATP-dependent DNA helicase PcrA